MSSKQSTQDLEAEVGLVTRGMLTGTIHYLEGAQRLVELRNLIGAYANDPDFMPFVAILSEIRTLPCDTQQEQWSKVASKKESIEIEKSVVWAKDFSLQQCLTLAQRYDSSNENQKHVDASKPN